MELLAFSLNNIFALLKQMAVFLVIAYLFTKSPFFLSFHVDSLRWRQLLLLYGVFSSFSILGTYFGLPINDAIANTRAIGAVLAGIIGGPLLGGAVGLTAGIHRFSLGGFTALSCGLSTTMEGLIGGLVHLYLVRRFSRKMLLNPLIAFVTTMVAEILQMLIILLVAKPFTEALELVRIIALPMILANAAGAAIFVSIIRDQRRMRDELGVAFSEKALKLAEKTVSILDQGFTKSSANQVAAVIREETGVGAVAITDKERLMAFVGIGDDHHLVGSRIKSVETLRAIKENRVVYSDGGEKKWACNRSQSCPLGSLLCVPLRVDNELIGSINLFEPKNKLFLVTNRSLGEGITRLLSGQMLSSRYTEQKSLLTKAELKLAQAQVNPHFLFNALNTIIAIIRNDSVRARELLLHLSNYFRQNLKRTGEVVTLEEELDHVQSYLIIENARFEDRLDLEMNIDSGLLTTKLPMFTLQPLVENAIKHGISQMLDKGVIKISAQKKDTNIYISIEDNAGNFIEKNTPGEAGLGMNIVEKRIKNLFGEKSDVTVECIPHSRTTVTLVLPEEGKC